MNNEREIIYRDRFERKERLGSGSYGSVYKVYDKCLKEYFAIKIEPYNTRSKRELNALNAVDGATGFLDLIDHFKEGAHTLHIVFTLVGTTLHDHIKKTYKDKKVDLKTVLLIADQLIDRLKTLHGCGYVHRDLKTDNFAMGLGLELSTLYMLDLGLVKRIKTDTNHHIHMNSGHDLIGNSRYCSLNSHRGYTLSRRDDLESMAYLLISFLRGGLPWSNLHDYHDIYRMKRGSVTELCRDLEPEFAEFLRYAKNLDFKKKPDYVYVKSLFRRVATRHQIEYDGIFSWMTPEIIAQKQKAEEDRQAFIKSMLLKVSMDRNRHTDSKKLSVPVDTATENIPPETNKMDTQNVQSSNHENVQSTLNNEPVHSTNEPVHSTNIMNPETVNRHHPINMVNKKDGNDTCPADMEAISSVNTETLNKAKKRKADTLECYKEEQ